MDGFNLNQLFWTRKCLPTSDVRGRETEGDGGTAIRETEREDRKQTRDEDGRAWRKWGEMRAGGGD